MLCFVDAVDGGGLVISEYIFCSIACVNRGDIGANAAFFCDASREGCLKDGSERRVVVDAHPGDGADKCSGQCSRLNDARDGFDVVGGLADVLHDNARQCFFAHGNRDDGPNSKFLL